YCLLAPRASRFRLSPYTTLFRSQQAGAGLHQQAVGVTVVAALELDDGIAPGEAAREPDGAHRGLGARADQTHHLDRRQARADGRSEEHTSELQSRENLVCRLSLE